MNDKNPIFEYLKKALYIFLAIYFITLAIVPCGDRNDCNDLKKSELCQDAHKATDHQDEDCTPFCVCSCCAAHFLIREFQSPLNLVATINSVYTIHHDAETSSAIIAIWQPPKIA